MPVPSLLRHRAESPAWQRTSLYRMLRRPLVYWSAVALLVILTFMAVARQSDRQRRLETGYGELIEVPVAAALIRAGEPLHAESVRWEQRPSGGVPPGAVTELAEGAVAAAAIYPGEVVHTERVAGHGAGLSSRLAPGVAAVSLPAGYGLPPVQPGDRVSLIAVVDDFVTDSVPESRMVARHATVLEVAEEAITVAVRESELQETVSALVWGTIAIVATPTPTA